MTQLDHEVKTSPEAMAKQLRDSGYLAIMNAKPPEGTINHNVLHCKFRSNVKEQHTLQSLIEGGFSVLYASKEEHGLDIYSAKLVPTPGSDEVVMIAIAGSKEANDNGSITSEAKARKEEKKSLKQSKEQLFKGTLCLDEAEQLLRQEGVCALQLDKDNIIEDRSMLPGGQQ